MRKLHQLLLPLSLLLTSCASEYNIAGNTSVPYLDGRVLSLRIAVEGDGMPSTVRTASVCLDSCRVEHGKFSFFGQSDSTVMAMIYTGPQCVMPLVLENGNLEIQISNVLQSVTGGPLNDRLYDFFKKRGGLDNQMYELQQQAIRMMREGRSLEEVDKKIGQKMKRLSEKSEEMETRFVRENFDNVLGPGFFMMLCNQYPSPVITEQIQKIISGAPQHFLNDPFVKCYLHEAEENGSGK